MEEKEKKKSSLKYLLQLLPYVRRHMGMYTLGLVLLVLSSVSLLGLPYFLGQLVDVAQGKEIAFFDSLSQLAVALAVLLVVQAVLSFGRVYTFSFVSERAVAAIRNDLFTKLVYLPLSFYDRTRRGELISRITADVSLLQSTLSTTLAEFIRQAITLVVGTAAVFWIAPNLSLFMLSVFPVLIGVAMVFGRYIRRLSRRSQEKLAESNVVVEEALQGIHVVKAYTGEDYETKRYAKGLEEVVQTALKGARFRGGFVSFIIFALFGAIVAVMWYGATLVQAGQLQVGELTSFVLYAVFIGASIAGLGDMLGQVQKAAGASERLLEIMHQEEREPGSEQSTASLPTWDQPLRFQGVHFAYPTRPELEVLRSVDLQIAPGEKVALVGPSGAGKSTITQLILRYYQPQQGNVCFGQQSIEEIDLKAWRRQIAIVPQEVALFGGTIRQNIGYGQPHATEQQLVEAAKKAYAWDFIKTFPDGLDTLIGDRGVQLSGGQRQRVAIARAILKNAGFLILDEATSSLDAESEQMIQLALEQLMKDRTTLIIAHRLSTIKKVDRILVVNHGEIVEQGGHSELLTQGGLYQNLVSLQLEA